MMYIRILGPIEYHYTLIMMKKTLRMRIRGSIGDHIYFLEHKPVITLGRDGSLDNIIAPYMDMPIFYVKRGGDVTLHSPGQLVVYPIVKLDERGFSLPDFIKILEEAVINVLSEYGLEGYWKKGTAGVWVGEKKIASIGIAVDHWTAYHGLAFNVNNDLKLFKAIRPCGLDPMAMTSLEVELGSEVDFEEVFRKMVRSIAKGFETDYRLEYMYRKEVIDFLYEETS